MSAPHRNPVLIALVFVGGALGTLARYGVELALPSPNGWPLATFAVNIAGAFVLGILLEVLLRRGSDSGWRQRLRLFGGTGVLGGFTSYSSLAVDTTTLIHDGQWGQAVIYALVSLLFGVAAAAAGIAIARNLTVERPQ